MPSSSRSSEPAALRALFEPASVALVGASARNMFTRPMLGSLRGVGYTGRITLIHPRGEAVEGVECVTSFAELPGPPDVAALLMGGSRALPALREALDAGVRAAIIYDGGFSDAGPAGAELQRELAAMAAEAGAAVLGPNCQGYLSPAVRQGLYLHEIDSGYAAGGAGLIAQSGSVADSLANNVQGVRWSHIVTTGNEAVVDLTDALGYLIDAPACRTICLFAELIRRPAEFLAECERAREVGKPIVLLKTARTAAGSAAARAHTGAIAYPERLLDAFLRAAPLIRVDSLEEMLAAVVLLETGRVARGRGVGLVTASGGMIELILDAAAPLELSFPPLAPETVAALDGVFQSAERIRNPLDIWPPAIDLGQTISRTFGALAADPAIDVVAFQSAVQLNLVGAGASEFGFDELFSAAADSEKPFVILDAVPGGPPAGSLERARAAGVAVLSGIDAGLRAIDVVAAFQGCRRRDSVAAPDLDEARVARIVGGLACAGATAGAPALDLLAALGLPVVRTLQVEGVEAVVEAARELGGPVVVKDGDPARLHKSESGGVAVGLRGPEEVAAAAGAMTDRGVGRFLVQEMVQADHELLVGLQRSPDLGVFLVCGLGGIWTEILDDAAIRRVGLRRGEARAMIEALRGYPALAGARGRTPVDVDALAGVLERLDWLGRRHGDVIESVDLNPVLVRGDAVFCVDAVFVPIA